MWEACLQFTFPFMGMFVCLVLDEDPIPLIQSPRDMKAFRLIYPIVFLFVSFYDHKSSSLYEKYK